MDMTTRELRKAYLDFFSARGHAVIPSSSLIPENDPTVLFTTAGMQPLVPYLLGALHPAGRRLVNVQKCIRTSDIDEVGDATHLTFFEMLGNWSLQDYFKKESIAWSFEFLTHILQIPLEKLAFSVFAGEGEIPRDEESAALWMSLGVSPERIAYLGKEDNWWGPAGQTGPCGPDTEIFFWTGTKPAPKVFEAKDARWVEIWNNVFMQYEKDAQGIFHLLADPSVDTGMGMERTVAVLNGMANVYEIEDFQHLFRILETRGKATNLQEEERWRALRIVSDHVRAAVMIMGDGVIPSNKDQGYILRRLIRRAVRYGRLLGITNIFLADLAQTVVEDFSDRYPVLKEKSVFIGEILTAEEEKFSKTLEKGLKEFERLCAQKKIIGGQEAFLLYATFGFPLELTQEMATAKGQKIDEKTFHAEFQKHQELSRSGAEQKFSGGLADHSEETTKLHTTTHLLQSALRHVLGPQVFQRGSNITQERLRFDFSFERKMTSEEITQTEQFVNHAIEHSLPIVMETMTVEQAKERGALGVFEEKYAKLGSQVKVYSIGNQQDGFVSVEVCGGPHVENTSVLGHFTILKEEAVSAGVRRIKAVLEKSP
jgi:alanyl-tRNA synthetase